MTETPQKTETMMPGLPPPCDRDDCPFHEEDWDRRMQQIEHSIERTNDLLKWGVTLMVTVMIALGGFAYGGIDGRLKALEDNGSAPMRERVSRAEADVRAIAKTLDEIKDTQREILKRLER